MLAGEQWKAAGEHSRAHPTVHGEDTHKQSDVGGAIHREHPKTVLYGRRAKLKKTNQQNRGDAHNLPSCYEQVERAGGEREQRSESEKVQQNEKPEEAGLTMQIGGGELADQSG